MSKYMTFPDAQCKSLELLVAALTDLGWAAEQIETHDTAQHLYGYAGDRRKEVANVIVRRKNIGGLSNDLGFLRNEAGAYVPIVSEFDTGHLQYRLKKMHGHDRPFVASLLTAYNTRVAERVAERLHGRVTRTQVGNAQRIVVSY